MSEGSSAPDTMDRTGAVAFTRNLAIFLFLNAFLLNGLIWLAAPSGYGETTLDHTRGALVLDGSDDSWGAMGIALAHIRSGDPAPLYREVFFNQKVKFQYPPSSLLALMAMQWIAPDERVRTTDQDIYAWPTLNDAVALAFLLLTATATTLLLRRQLAEIGWRDEPGLQTGLHPAIAAALVFGLALTFYPLVKAFTLGQIQVWINGVFALAMFCWAAGRPAASGALIGIICLIKPHYALFVIWALLRRQWNFALACLLAGGAGLLVSIMAFGLANHLDYLPVLSFLAERGETYYPNHSVNGLLNRIMSVTEPDLYRNLDWGDGGFPPFNRFVYWPTTLSSAAILLAALLHRRSNDRVLDFATMAVSVTMASPIAWEHHYGVLFPIYAVALVRILHDRARLIPLVVSYALASNYIMLMQLLAASYWNVLQSYLLFAAVILLVILHWPGPAPRRHPTALSV